MKLIRLIGLRWAVLFALVTVGIAVSSVWAATAVISADACASWSWNPTSATLSCVPAGTIPPKPPDPPQPPTWNGTCPGFDKTLIWYWDWSQNPSFVDSLAQSGITPNGILVIPFVPTGPNDYNNIASISATGYPAPNMINYVTLALSTTPCDLNPLSPGQSTSTTPTVRFGVGTVQKPWSGPKTAVELTPGVRYYLNIASRADGQNTCINPPSGWNCDVRVSLEKPPGH